MSERCLVIGGGGFLGRHLTQRLVASGRRVRVFDLRVPATPLDVTVPSLVEFFEGSIFNSEDVEAALEGVDVVFHLVSTTVPSSSIHSTLVEVESNVAATARILDAMTRRGIRRFGYPSSGGTVYGASNVPHVEDEPLRPTCPYGLGKAMIEDMIRFFGSERGLEYQIWRIANPYGDTTKVHMNQGVVDAFLHRARTGQPIRIWGEGDAIRDFIFVDDVVSAIELLLERDAWRETVNIGTGVGVSVKQLLEVIGREIPRELTVVREQGYTGPSVSVLDVGKLGRLTGWSPRHDLASGIREAWRRYGG